MSEKIKNREEWSEANGYKIFCCLTCVNCKHFKADMETPAQGNCNLMDEDGIKNACVAVTAVCDLFTHPNQ